MAKLNSSVEVKDVKDIASELKLVSDGQQAVEGIASNWFGDVVALVVSAGNDTDKEDFVTMMDDFESVYNDVAELTKIEHGGHTYIVRGGEVTIDGNKYTIDKGQRTVTIDNNKVKVHKETMPGAYRSSKSVIGKAIELGICLVDDEGMPKGKTALENEIKAEKVEKTELEKFKIAIETAGKIAGKLDTLEDVEAAQEAVRELYSDLTDKYVALSSKAAA